MVRMKLSAFILAVLMALLQNTVSFAQEKGPALTGTGVTERIDFIQQGFDDGKTRAQVWWYGWMAVYGGAAAASYTIGFTSNDRTTRITQIVSGVESTIGLAGLLLSPMVSAYAPSDLREMPSGTPDESTRKLREAERYLKEAAEGQELGRSWISHSLNLLVNAGGAMVIWKGYGDEIRHDGGSPSKEALVNFAAGFIVGEIQILTQPLKSVRDLDAYRRRYGAMQAGRGIFEPRFFVLPTARGMYAGAALLF